MRLQKSAGSKSIFQGQPDRNHAVRGGSRRVPGKQAGKILLHPFCGARHGQPVGPAGFGSSAFATAREILRTSNSTPATSCVIRLHARLVTISSCYGSGLRSYAGEGLVGLSWAFLRAGAHNVIGALWEVNDASTPLLMDGFMARLEAGSTPDDALRAAKLSLIHSSGCLSQATLLGGISTLHRLLSELWCVVLRVLPSHKTPG